MYDRECEYAFYLMKLAKLHRKQNKNALLINDYFKLCKAYSDKIIDYELEHAKHIFNVRNAVEAH